MASATAGIAGRTREAGGGAGRGLALLTVLFDARRPLDVTAVARAARTTRGTAHRQLRELQALGFVTRADDGCWCLPPGGVVTLSDTLIARVNLRAAARPVIERIAARTGETVTVCVRHREHRMRIDAIDGRPPRLPVPVGETLPLYTGTCGKSILAFLSRAEIASVVAEAVAADIDDRRLRADMARVRRSGHLAAVGDRLPDLASISVPVFGVTGIAGAVTVVGPADRWAPDLMRRAAAGITDECAALSAALGSLPPVD